ncbi:MAG: gliding motility-associated C-terminal domain-containing protein, partial [Bacteroidales bacterium]|nr:gliding motility-associated C-terminal domain-containing protein [Bacteroidales bacterium]
IYQSVCASCGGCQHFPTYPTGPVWSEVNHSDNCNNALFKFEFESAVVLEPRNVCNHLPVQIGPANPSSTATYTWKPAGLVSNSSLPNPFTTNIQNDTTLVLFILEGPCLDSVYQPVYVENVQYLLPDSLSGCEFDTFDLAAIQMADSSSVLWSHQPDFSAPFNVGQEELAIEQSASGYVYFLAESSHCSYIDSVWLKVDNLETGMVDSTFICLGDTLLLQALTYPNQSLNYLWHPDSIMLSDVSNPAVSVLPAQNQWVYVDVANEECFNRDSIWVGISPLSMHTGELILEEVDSIYRTQTATIEAEQIWGVNYVWTPSGSLNDSTASTVLANPQNTTDYLLEISDAIGCFIEDSIKIIVLDVYCDESHVYVPNGFSPNNDGKNDKLFVRTKMGNSIAFSVYSRLGEKVFETSDPAIGWDGSYKGEQLEPAVFVYHLFVTCWDGSNYETHGNITLIR